MKLTEGHPEVHRVLSKNAPKSKPGRKKKNTVVDDSIFTRRTTSKPTMSARLAQEHPDYYEAYLRGEYNSVTEAAIAAGLIKDDANLRRAKSAFRKMSADEHEEFAKWLRTKEAKELRDGDKKKK